MNKYYAALLLFIGALTTSPIAAETGETTEDISQDAFTPKKKKLTKKQKIGIGAGVGTTAVVLLLLGLGWKFEWHKAIKKKFGKNEETDDFDE